MYIICGLGNPGREYEATRHNMGFLAIDVLSEKLGIKMNRIKCRSLTGDGQIGCEKVLLVKPQTFMNNSGEAVRLLMDYFKVESSHVIVIYDDIDLPAGGLRVRPFGGAGTHNGMRSILAQIHTEDFPRIRVGTGSNGRIPLEKYVIGKWTEEERPLLADAVARAAEAACAIVEDGIDKAMNKYNISK